MSPDRLAELRRQRALVAQHLAWIDAELIAAGAGHTPAPSSPAASAPSSPPSSDATASEPKEASVGTSSDTPAAEIDPALALANARADEIIEKYRATEALDPKAARRGCLVLFGAAFALLGALLLAIYYFGYMQN
jgi:hypothetical protein